MSRWIGGNMLNPPRNFWMRRLGVMSGFIAWHSARYAARLPMRDFEDALQAAAAIACGADAIATA